MYLEMITASQTPLFLEPNSRNATPIRLDSSHVGLSAQGRTDSEDAGHFVGVDVLILTVVSTGSILVTPGVLSLWMPITGVVHLLLAATS